MSAIGVRLRDANLSLADMARLSTVADGAGYESVWLPESMGRDAIAELIALSGATERIAFGTGIIPVFGRTPTLTAAAMTTAATMAPGRVILGVGIGHRDGLVAGHGVDFSRPVARTREFVEVARPLLRGERVSYHGEIFKISGYQPDCAPPAPVPVYIAALRPAMLRLAGAVADGVLMNWATPDRVRESIEHIHAGAREAGRSPRKIRVASYLRTCVSDDTGRVEQACRVQIARYGSMVYYRNYFTELGFGGEAEALEAAWAKGDANGAAEVVHAAMIRALTIYGTADECRERLAAYDDAGLDLTVVAPFPIGEPVAETFERTILGCASVAA